VEPGVRAEKRRAWNQPVLWPAFALLLLIVLIVLPGIWTYYRERQ
jgi:oligopeptide transport system substrate-binding protein